MKESPKTGSLRGHGLPVMSFYCFMFFEMTHITSWTQATPCRYRQAAVVHARAYS
ncbi:hypothetical protein [Aquitalea sp. ASV11]|uniref:hypothetical protein n=1 Tax=Aquitalea sp. ASV11 TaxID=2795103 RepID=UPI0018EBD06E|nr:hypothetical protein [Aquitalea sp. ASV11]